MCNTEIRNILQVDKLIHKSITLLDVFLQTKSSLVLRLALIILLIWRPVFKGLEASTGWLDLYVCHFYYKQLILISESAS